MILKNTEEIEVKHLNVNSLTHLTHLEDWIEEAQTKGATHFEFHSYVEKEGHISNRWLKAHRLKSDEEIRREKISQLEMEIEELKRV